MLIKAISLSLTAVACASLAHAQNSCPVNVGSLVAFQDGKTIFDGLSAGALVKGEFETTEAFEARKAAALSTLDITKPILAKAIYDPEQVSYDADRQTFTVKTYAWDNVGMSADQAFPRGNPSGLEVGILGNYEVALDQTETATGSYEASNAYGATATVLQSTRITYGVFDRPHPRGTYGNSGDWASSTTAGQYNSPAVEIYVPIENAPAVKSGMQVGIAILPKEPFVGSGEYTNTPKMPNPREVTSITHVIVADILCAVIADQDGLVLATVNPGY